MKSNGFILGVTIFKNFPIFGFILMMENKVLQLLSI